MWLNVPQSPTKIAALAYGLKFLLMLFFRLTPFL